MLFQELKPKVPFHEALQKLNHFNECQQENMNQQ